MALFGKKKTPEQELEQLQKRMDSSLKNSKYGKDAWVFFFGWTGDGKLRGNEDFYRMSMNPLNYVPAQIRQNTPPSTKTYTWRFGDWSNQTYSGDALSCLSEFGFSKKTNSRYQGTDAEKQRLALGDAMSRKVKSELGVVPEADTKVYVTKNQGAYGEVFAAAFKVRYLSF
jgi:hypothetical protein